MQIKIANKEYTLYFGWEFLKEINKSFGITVEQGGQEMNTRQGGLAFMNAGLDSYNPVAIIDIIKAATNTEPQKPATVNVQKAVEEKLLSGTKEYKAFVDELKDTIKKEPMLKALSELNQ